MNKMFHVFSEGENVLFRENGDYIFFNNRFASSCHTLHMQALAETTMSTHFHSIAETIDESAVDELMSKLRKAYGIYYASKYGYSLGNTFRISKVEVTTRESYPPLCSTVSFRVSLFQRVVSLSGRTDQTVFVAIVISIKKGQLKLAAP